MTTIKWANGVDGWALMCVYAAHQMWGPGDSGGVRADLRAADLRGAYLYGANLRGADLRGADLGGAELRKADLSGADFSGANFSAADLRGAYLYGANLRRANLYRANLSEANLYGANLHGANLHGANLRGADLSGARDIVYASVSWHGHGECGRQLLGVVIDGEPQLFCGCFHGSADDLRAYIADGEDMYSASRTRALEIVLELLAWPA